MIQLGFAALMKGGREGGGLHEVRFSGHAGRMTIRLGELAPAECRDMEESNNWHLANNNHVK